MPSSIAAAARHPPAPPPHHGRGAGTPEINVFGEPCSYSEVFGDRGGYEDLRFRQMRSYDAVDDIARQSSILERGGRQFCPLFDGERRGRGLVQAFGRKLNVPDDCGLSA